MTYTTETISKCLQLQFMGVKRLRQSIKLESLKQG